LFYFYFYAAKIEKSFKVEEGKLCYQSYHMKLKKAHRQSTTKNTQVNVITTKNYKEHKKENTYLHILRKDDYCLTKGEALMNT
jgi:hypothetical protein